MTSRGFIHEEIMSKADLVAMDEEFIDILSYDQGNYQELCNMVKQGRDFLAVYVSENQYSLCYYSSTAEMNKFFEENYGEGGWALHKIFDLGRRERLQFSIHVSLVVSPWST